MLDARAARLAAGDAEGYLRPLTPAARAAEEAIARGAASAPLRRMEITLDPAAQPEEGGRAFRNARVDLAYLYDGLPDDNRFRVSFRYDLERRGGWVVTAARLGPGADLPVWATGPVENARSNHFLALFRPGTARLAEALDLAEQARSALAGKLTFETDAVHLILLGADRQQYEQMAAGQAPISAIAQSETAFEIRPTEITVLGRQVVVNLDQLFAEPRPVETFQHELAHLALAPVTRPFTPGWVAEAAAMFLAGTRPVNAWRVGFEQGRFATLSFTDLGSITRLGEHDPTGETTSFQYAYAAAAAWYLVETFGAERFWELYRAFAEVPAEEVYREVTGDGRPTAEPSPAASDLGELASRTAGAALQRIYGLAEAELDLKVREWIRAAAA